MPPPRKAYPPRPRPAIGPYEAIVDGWLLADREVPRKQRHTARRVWQRLVAEHGAGVAEVTVSRYVARRRAELGLDRIEVMVPQAHEPGAEAEVDFGGFHAMIAGALAKLWLFVMRLSCSGRAFHVAFATQAQEAFLEGHVLAFEYFGAVPAGFAMTTSGPQWSGCCAAGTGPSPSGSSPCAPIRVRLVLLHSCKEGAHEKPRAASSAPLRGGSRGVYVCAGHACVTGLGRRPIFGLAGGLSGSGG